MPVIRTKRIYDAADPVDGVRVLVDKLWPRGINKSRASLDSWAKELAPSTELRKLSHNGGCDREEFTLRYIEEIREKQEYINDLIRLIQEEKVVTFLFASKSVDFNNATVLRDYCERIIAVEGGQI